MEDEDIAALNGYENADGDNFDDLFDDADELFQEGDNQDQEQHKVNGNANQNGGATPAGYTDDVPMDGLAGEDLGNNELDDLLGEGAVAGQKMDLSALSNLNAYVLQPGEKAENAIDFEDIDDDDLIDEEEETTGGPVQPPESSFLEGIEESAAQPEDDPMDDDLFGDDGDLEDTFAFSAQGDDISRADVDKRKARVEDADDQDAAAGTNFAAALAGKDAEMSEEDQREYRLQQLMLSGNNEEAQIEAFGIRNKDLWLAQNFPMYDRDDEAPFWNKILPPKLGTWKDDKKPKKPKVLRPNKVTLDIEPDQKVLFTTPATAAVPMEPRLDLVYFTAGKGQEKQELLDESESDDELPNGLTDQDLELMCTDFDTLSHLADEEFAYPEPRIVGEDLDMSDLEDFNDFEQPMKKRRTGLSAHDIVTIHRFDLPSFDDPEKMTARLAHEVVLDLNDSELLVEDVDQEALARLSKAAGTATQASTIKERLAHRFKTSNDSHYDQLQRNQRKVRGQLTNTTIDHSIPAVRLQYPYYQVKLTPRDLRNWHRKQVLFKGGIAFSKINKQRRKDYKGKPVREAYHKTRDLSIADNSYALLVEYSEEHPTMLSQTGMGNKIVNYYRKLNTDDAARPKAEIGETSVLMPEDKSPFNNFGHIDPGESTLALYNSMFRAPIFKQKQDSQDFLIVREVTGMNGQIHYLRNIDYQYIVGQELPTVQVPGPNARMVTTVSKNRLKAISWRIARRKKNHRLRVEEVTRHFPDTNDMQNRQKMKEFMSFNKEHKEWEMKGADPIPDEEEIQKSLIPEEICLLESMQVGNQYLHDSGYADDDAGGDDDKDDDDKDEKNMSVEQQLAPWKTTKNFIQATQGKAMLRLYGEGDPSGRGEAFSFIKTSMKGGFKAQGLSANENVAGSRGSATGGHTYNVAKQQASYDNSIRDIWDKQKAVLSSQVEPENIDDEGVDGQLDEVARRNIRATPASGMQTPSGRRRDDETGTSFSKRSANSQAQKFLRIRRQVFNPRTEQDEPEDVVEADPQVIKLYLKRKAELQHVHIDDFVPTGDEQVDAARKRQLEETIERLQSKQTKRRKKNRPSEATIASPSAGGAGSPDADGNYTAPTPTSGGGRNTQQTQRKCANCGQIGHIKTNKKLCPLLNGEMQPDSTGPMDSSAFMGAPPSMS